MYDWIIKWEAVINDGLQPTLFIWIEQQYEKPHNSDVSGWPVTKIFILSFLIDAETLLIKKKRSDRASSRKSLLHLIKDGAHHCVWQPDGFWRQLGLPAVSVGN